MERLIIPQGQFTLGRHPLRKNDALRAWDAADEYLLRYVAESLSLSSSGAGPTLLIVNDASGALATALAAHRPWALSDSYLSRVATRSNLERNRLDPAAVTLITSFDPLPAPVDIALVKVPKSLALLEDQLHRIRPALRAGAVVIGAAMVKHVHSSTLELFERILGPTRTSLAVKKARLVVCEPDPHLAPPPNPWPASYTVPPGNEVITSHAGVFSPARLDVGTRFFLGPLLEHVARRPGAARVVDLGCGNGVVGVMVALRNPQAELTFIDESYRAVASAEASFRANLGPDRVARFVVGDNLFDLAEGPPIAQGSVDLVVNNPPFHTERAIDDEGAGQMFLESRAALRPGGELWVVGNLHLAYQATLRRLFGNCDAIAANDKFAVLRATRR